MKPRTIPRKMKAAILVSHASPLIIGEVILPESLEPGQVLVKVICSGICGSQIGEIDGVKGPDPFLPHLLGHEGAGSVINTGPGVRTVKPGDSVVLHWMKGVGLESSPPSYRWNGRKLNAGWVTTFNEYAIVSENRLTRVPESLDPRIAALFGCALTTGLGVISNNARLKIGESIIVIGAGGVGLNVILGARLVTAYPIVALDIHDSKLDLAKRLGATHTFNTRTAIPKEKILKLVGPDGADVVVDNTGIPSVIRHAYEMTKPKGRTILVGVPKKGNDISIYSLPLHFGKVITGSHGGETNPSEDIPRYIKIYEAGKMELDDLIGDEFPLERINTALSRMRSGEINGRCIINVSS